MTYPFGAAKAELERSYALAAAEGPAEHPPVPVPVPTAGREPLSESDWAVLLHELPEH